MLKINNFDLKTICKNPHIFITGCRLSERSLAIYSLLDNFSNIDEENSIIISFHDFIHEKIFPQKKIINTFDLELIRNIINKQITTNKKNNCVIVLDDCLSYHLSYLEEPIIIELLCNARNYNISLIVAAKGLLNFPLEIRRNFDYVFIYSTLFFSRTIKDHYADYFENLNLFREYLKQLTNDYSSMVIVNKKLQDILLNKIFRYKAKNIYNLENTQIISYKKLNNLISQK